MLCATWWFQVPGWQPPLPESTRRLRWSHGQPSLVIHWWTLDIGHHFGAVQNIFHWLIIYFTPYFTTTCRCHRLGHGSIAVFQIGNQGWSSLPSEDSECCRLFPSFGFIITLRALFIQNWRQTLKWWQISLMNNMWGLFYCFDIKHWAESNLNNVIFGNLPIDILA